MSHADVGHASGRGSAPYQHLAPFDALLTKLEELQEYSREPLINFPKIERFILTAEIRHCLEALERYAITSWKMYHKKTTLRDMDVEVEVLRRKVRKAQERGYISPGQYRDWSGHINDLGRILGGWIKHENSRQGGGRSRPAVGK